MADFMQEMMRQQLSGAGKGGQGGISLLSQILGLPEESYLTKDIACVVIDLGKTIGAINMQNASLFDKIASEMHQGFADAAKNCNFIKGGGEVGGMAIT